MTDLAYTDITVTPVDPRNLSGRQREVLCKLVFGDGALTYPSGGIDLSAAAAQAKFGAVTGRPLRYLSPIQDQNLTTGTKWFYDPVTQKLRAFEPTRIPRIVVEEAVTLSSHAGTLAYKPAYIIMAEGTISATVTPLLTVPSSVTVAAGQMKVNFTTGAVTCAAADSVSGLKVTYVPQQPVGFFSAANMVVDEVITLASAGVNTASRAALIQHVYQTAATAAVQTFSHAAGSTNLLIVDVNNTGATTLTSTSNDGKAAVITYLKYSGLPNPAYTFKDQTSLSLASQIYQFGLTGTEKTSVMIPGFGNQVINLETTNYTQSKLGSTVTAANLIGKYNLMTQTITTAQTSASTSLPENWFVNYNPAYFPDGGMAELTTNAAPIATTLYFVAVF